MDLRWITGKFLVMFLLFAALGLLITAGVALFFKGLEWNMETVQTAVLGFPVAFAGSLVAILLAVNGLRLSEAQVDLTKAQLRIEEAQHRMLATDAVASEFEFGVTQAKHFFDLLCEMESSFVEIKNACLGIKDRASEKYEDEYVADLYRASQKFGDQARALALAVKLHCDETGVDLGAKLRLWFDYISDENIKVLRSTMVSAELNRIRIRRGERLNDEPVPHLSDSDLFETIAEYAQVDVKALKNKYSVEDLLSFSDTHVLRSSSSSVKSVADRLMEMANVPFNVQYDEFWEEGPLTHYSDLRVYLLRLILSEGMEVHDPKALIKKCSDSRLSEWSVTLTAEQKSALSQNLNRIGEKTLGARRLELISYFPESFERNGGKSLFLIRG